jgi:hypothetical protein
MNCYSSDCGVNFYVASALTASVDNLRGARATGPPPVKGKPLTVAGAVLAATARALRYLVSRSMTRTAMSRAMASTFNAPGICNSFLRGYDPGTRRRGGTSRSICLAVGDASFGLGRNSRCGHHGQEDVRQALDLDVSEGGDRLAVGPLHVGGPGGSGREHDGAHLEPRGARGVERPRSIPRRSRGDRAGARPTRGRGCAGAGGDRRRVAGFWLACAVFWWAQGVGLRLGGCVLLWFVLGS